MKSQNESLLKGQTPIAEKPIENGGTMRIVPLKLSPEEFSAMFGEINEDTPGKKN